MTTSELIIWNRPEDAPDDDETVLVQVVGADSWTGEREIFLGYFDAGVWRSINSEPTTISAWAELPAGPTWDK